MKQIVRNMKQKGFFGGKVTLKYDNNLDQYYADYEVINFTESRLNKSDLTVDEEVTIRNGNGFKQIPANQFSYSMIKLQIDQNIVADIGKSVYNNGISLAYYANGWVQMYVQFSKGRYTCLDNGTDTHTLPDDCKIINYGYSDNTASDSRSFSGTFVDLSYNRYDLLNEASNGALDIIYKRASKLRGREKEIFILKNMTYIGNIRTGSRNIGVANNYAYYLGKAVNNTNEYYLTEEWMDAWDRYNACINTNQDEAVIEAAKNKLEEIKAKHLQLEAPTNDGQGFINVEALTPMMNDYCNYEFQESDLVGEIAQIRPSTCKDSSIVVPKNVFYGLVEGYKALADRRRKMFLEMADKATKKKDKAKFLEKAENEKVVIVGDENNLLFVCDKNCLKVDYDLTSQITMEVLAFGKTSNGKSSKQLDESIIYAGNELGEDAPELLYQLHSLELEEQKARLLKQENKILTPEEVIKASTSKYTVDAINALYPKIKTAHRGMFDSAAKQMINNLVNLIDGMNAPIKSTNRRLANEIIFILTGGKVPSIMKFGEVFVNGKATNRMIMIKYPKIGVKEYYACKNISLKTIKKRLSKLVQNNVITTQIASICYNFYASLDKSVAVLPACMLVTYACAGLDYDFDGAMFIEETKTQYMKPDKTIVDRELTKVEELTNKIVDMLFNIDMEAVVIRMKNDFNI